MSGMGSRMGGKRSVLALLVLSIFEVKFLSDTTSALSSIGSTMLRY